MSLVSWLDVSAEEHRRMRELAALFELGEAREELGLASLRDDIADALFPGTSTLHTRARYTLIVPWCFQAAAKAGGSMEDLARVERQAIETLRNSKLEIPGLLGRTAGAGLKTLPSSLYWSALQRWGIVAERMSRPDALANSRDRRHDAEDESNDQTESIWDVLPAPDGFPKRIDGGLDLTPAEQVWLRERLLTSAPDSLLAHFAKHAPSAESSAPWDDPAALDAPSRVRELLELARGFSALMHGAQLLYNLLLAEARLAARPNDASFQESVPLFRAALTSWAQHEDLATTLEGWRLEALEGALRGVLARPRKTDDDTADFVRQWQRLMNGRDLNGVADDDLARELVARRELHVKGTKARLRSERRLLSWGGSSGAGALTYRWGTVRGLMLDIHAGAASV
ncbi:DUF6361 family protein [Agrococcus pavilionensis]|uniref:DUF6361 family protein n=1 Tax=Agrococcus pavilionensis TaxID=1346502 RepID=UPI001181ABC9|nr:DUF6361 family protein [Agrococcus pavilionensis]